MSNRKISKTVTIDTSGFDGLEYKVLVKPVEVGKEIELKGGFKLIRPDETHEREQHAAMEGKIVSMSPFAFTYEEWPAGARKPQVGDVVVFARYAGLLVKGVDGIDYRVMNDKDIMLLKRAA